MMNEPTDYMATLTLSQQKRSETLNKGHTRNNISMIDHRQRQMDSTPYKQTK